MDSALVADDAERAPGQQVAVRKSGRVLSLRLSTLPLYCFTLWLLCLLYTAVNIMYPSRCGHARGSLQYMQSCYEPLFPIGQRIDVRMYTGLPNERNSLSGELVWELTNHSMDTEYDASFHVPIPPSVRTDSHYLNSWIVITPTVDPERDPVLTVEYAAARRVVTSHLLTTLHPVAVQTQERDLLSTFAVGGESHTTPVEQPASHVMCQHWKYGYHPLTIRYTHYGALVLGNPFLASLGYVFGHRFVPIAPSNPSSRSNLFQMTYEPILFVDDIALLRRHEIEMSRNVSRTSPKMRLKFAPTSSLHFGFKKTMTVVLDVMRGLLNEPEVEEIKYWMSDERLYRYFVSQVITIAHVILEYLAFRDDWKFFVGRKSFNGISSTSLIFSVVRSAVIFLYLFDADTSSLVLASVGKDVLWSAWKVIRIVKPRIYMYKGFLPSVTYLEQCNLDTEEKESARLDTIATAHMSLCVYPCVIGLAIYSLLNYKYKSWWTWFISSLADSVYFFGFISMTPQLYINYKMQSVAHLPIRAFIYKIFSTFIDDVFAFMVKMPLKHRLMCLRDDVIFLGFLYQWWAYRVDKSRENEYGFRFNESEIDGKIENSQERKEKEQ